VSQGIDTDASNPVSTLILQVLAAVAEFEREIIRERTIAGVRAAKAKGKTLGRPRIVFKRDEVLRLRDSEGLSWRAIGTRLNVTASTALNVYRELSPSPSSVQKPSPHSRPHSTRKRAS
jgi:DNA invertase Pin-like site-specific DNA recombinase